MSLSLPKISLPRVSMPDLNLPRPKLPGFVPKAVDGVRDAAGDAGRAVVDAGGVAVDRTRYAGGFAVGAAKESVNALATFGEVPIYTGRIGGWYRAQGSIFEPQGPAQNAGADAVDDRLRDVGLMAEPTDRAVERDGRPVLALSEHSSDGKLPTLLSIAAVAEGANWSSDKRPSGLASIYVDGQYHSDVSVLSERPGEIGVNLGVLGKGNHRIEVRDARSMIGADAAPTTVSALTARQLTGDEALAARYQPILEGRDLGLPGGKTEAAWTDTPLAIVPAVKRNDDGTTTIDYSVLFSNEDGGTSTQQLYRETGRVTDYERFYTVRLDAQGRKVGEWFEGPRHDWFPFTGQHDGDRPLIRVATSNNNFSQRMRNSGTRWSEMTEPVGSPTGAFDTMLNNPWMFEVMGEELFRENRVTTRPTLIQPRKVYDPRTYLYLQGGSDPARQALEAGKAVQLKMRDGSLAEMTMGDAPSRFPTNPAAIPLPANVDPDRIEGIVGAEGRLWVLDDRFTPRRLPTLDTGS